jgi:hypothetical protein
MEPTNIKINNWFESNAEEFKVEQTKPSEARDPRKLAGLTYTQVRDLLETNKKIAIKIELANDYDSSIHEEPEGPNLTVNHLTIERKFDLHEVGKQKRISAFDFVWGGGNRSKTRVKTNKQDITREILELKETLTGAPDRLIRAIKRERIDS